MGVRETGVRGAPPKAASPLFWSFWAFLLFISICSALARCETADLELTKRVDIPAPYEGDSLVYTVTLTNRGPDDATGVEVSDPLPAGVTYLWHRVSQGSYEATTGRWLVGSLAASASAKLEITVSVDSGTAGRAIVNTAEVTKADQADPDSIPANGRLGEDDLGQVTIVPRPTAKVSGSLSASLTAYPQSTIAQVTKFDLDLRVYADFILTLSGLTVRSLARLDLAGLEYEALTISAVVGWLQISELFIFGRKLSTGELAFQRKVLSLQGQLQGLQLRNLLAWAANAPSRFEDTLAIWGKTAAGATLASETSLCLGPGCDHTLSYERITISGISLGGGAFRSITTFRPAEPIEERLALQFKLGDLATVNAALELWPALLVSSMTITATNDLWRMVLNYDSQFNLSRGTVTLLLPLVHGFSVNSTTTIVPGEELDELLSTLVRTGPWELRGTSVFSHGQFQSVEFSLQLTSAELGFLLSARFTPTGLEYLLGNLRIGF
ncbi:MAG: DUF11 domain-containing protein [Candidatus Bipolaricaulia bacterium]